MRGHGCNWHQSRLGCDFSFQDRLALWLTWLSNGDGYLPHAGTRNSARDGFWLQTSRGWSSHWHRGSLILKTLHPVLWDFGSRCRRRARHVFLFLTEVFFKVLSQSDSRAIR